MQTDKDKNGSWNAWSCSSREKRGSRGAVAIVLEKEGELVRGWCAQRAKKRRIGMANARVEVVLQGALRMLERERGKLDRQIEGIRSLLASERPRRQPKRETVRADGGGRGKSRMSVAARKAASARMRAYWERWRKKKGVAPAGEKGCADGRATAGRSQAQEDAGGGEDELGTKRAGNWQGPRLRLDRGPCCLRPR